MDFKCGLFGSMDSLRRAILLKESGLQEAKDNNDKVLEKQIYGTLTKLYDADQTVFLILGK